MTEGTLCMMCYKKEDQIANPEVSECMEVNAFLKRLELFQSKILAIKFVFSSQTFMFGQENTGSVTLSFPISVQIN